MLSDAAVAVTAVAVSPNVPVPALSCHHGRGWRASISEGAFLYNAFWGRLCGFVASGTVSGKRLIVPVEFNHRGSVREKCDDRHHYVQNHN